MLLLFTTATTALAQPSAAQLEKQAHETYQEAYLEDTPEAQAEKFEQAAGEFERAAEAYRAEGNEEKAAAMEAWVRAARGNAEVRKQSRGQAALFTTGAVAKILAPPPAPSNPGTFSIGALADFPLHRSIAGDYFPAGTFDRIRQSIYTDEALLEKLLEAVGGEFFLGTFSAEPSFSEPTFRPGVAYGLTGAWACAARLGVQVSVWRGEGSVSAGFPVTVIPFTDGEPRTEEGTIQTDWRQWQITGGGQWRLLPGALSPYLGAGLQWTHFTGLTTRATIGGQSLLIAEEDNESRWGGYAAVGLEGRVAGRMSLSGGLAWNTWLREDPAGQRSALSARIALRWTLSRD